MVSDLAETARSNQLTFLRVKSVKHEVMITKLRLFEYVNTYLFQVLVAPEDAFMVIVLQNTQDEES